MGLTQKDVATSLLVALSGSFQTSPSFYLDPQNGVTYNVATQTPQYKLNSIGDLESLPIPAATGTAAERQRAAWIRRRVRRQRPLRACRSR